MEKQTATLRSKGGARSANERLANPGPLVTRAIEAICLGGQAQWKKKKWHIATTEREKHFWGRLQAARQVDFRMIFLDRAAD